MPVAVLFLLTAAPAANVLGQSQGQKSTAPANTERQGAPDLVAILPNPMNGQLAVKNIGKGPAGPSKLTLDCQKEGVPSETGGCPDLPASAATEYFDPAFPKNLTIKVPALAPGEKFKHTISFWSTFHWPSGKYKFTAVADADHTIPQSNRKNKVATSTLTVP
jgi:hypothetical protein